MRTYIKILIGIVLFFMTALSVLGYLAYRHQDEVEQTITAELNSYFENTIHIDKFHLTFINHFPSARLKISNISIQDDDKEILKIGSIQAFFDLTFFLRDSIVLKRLIISDGYIESIVDINGKKPDIKFKKSKNTAQNQDLAFKIFSPDVEIQNFKIAMINKYKGNKTYATINKSLLKLNVNNDIITIEGDVDANLDSLISKTTILFMNKNALANNIYFKIDTKKGTKELIKGEIIANNLSLIPRISYQKVDSGNIVKLRIESSGGLDDHLELFNLPEGLSFTQLNKDANISISYNQEGFMNAIARPHNQLIFFIENAQLSSPSLPNDINNIQIKGNYNNGEEHIPASNNLIIDTLHLEIGDSYLSGRLNLSHFHDPTINGHFISEVDLNHFFHQEKVSASGSIKTDFYINSKISDLRTAHFEGNEFAKGKIIADSIELHFKDSNKKISIPYGKISLNNHLVNIDEINGIYDKAHFNISASLNNVDQFLLNKDELLSGMINLTSDGIDLKSFSASDTSNVSKDQNTGARSNYLLPNLDLKLNLTSKFIKGDFGIIENLSINSLLKKDNLNIENLEFNYQDGIINSKMLASFDTTGITSLTGIIQGNFDYLNVDEFPTSNNKSTNNSSSFELPQKTDIAINLNIKNGLVQDRKFSGLKMNTEVINNEIKIESKISDFYGGSIDLKSDAKFNNDGIWFIESSGNIHFEKLIASELLPANKSQNQKFNKASYKSLPEQININLDFSADTLIYGNNTFENIKTGLRASRFNLNIDHFNIDLPQGHGIIDINVHNYLDHNPVVKGNIKLNFDSLNIESLFDALSGFSSNENKSVEKSAHIIPDNFNLKLDINAGKVIYKKFELKDLNLSNTLENGVFTIDVMKFGYIDGDVNLSGLFVQNNDLSISGHLYSKGKRLSIEPILSALSKNDLYDGTHGILKGFVSFDAETLFEIDSSLNLIMDQNLFHCGILIEEGEIINNEQLEKTLSFIGHRAKEDILIDNTNIQIFLDGENVIIEDMYMNNSISNMNVFGKYYKYDSAIDINFKISLTDLLFRTKEKRQVNTTDGKVKLDKDLNLFIGLEGSFKQNKIKVHPKRKHKIRREELFEEIRDIELKYKTRLNLLYKKAEPKVQDSGLSLNN